MSALVATSGELADLTARVKRLEGIVASLVESPEGTVIIAPGQQILDGARRVWELNVAQQLVLNGVADTRTANVALAGIWGHQLHQQNAAGAWWVCSGVDSMGAPFWSPSVDPRGVVTPPPPPPAPDVLVRLDGPRGKLVSRFMFGLSTGALADNAFANAANPQIKAQLAQIRPTLMRVNANIGATADSMANWWTHAPDFMAIDSRLVMGVDINNPQAAEAFAARLKNAGHEIFWWEAGNEDDALGDAYGDKFVALADALHSVNPAYQVGGPIGTWWNSIDIATWAAKAGSKIGFYDLHSYPIDPGDSLDPSRGLVSGLDPAKVYAKALSFGDVAAAVNVLNQRDANGNPRFPALANLPVFLGEYNMNGAKQPSGLYGVPEQATYLGALYVAIVLHVARHSIDNPFTAALWEACQDSYYGVIGNAANGGDLTRITPQGRYLGMAGRCLGGFEMPIEGAWPAGLLAMASTNGHGFAVQLINPDLTKAATFSLGFSRPVTGLARWQVGRADPTGRSMPANLGTITVAPEQVVILTGAFS